MNINPKFREACKQAVRDLLKQGSFGTTPGGSCVYLSSDDKSCVAGLLFRAALPNLDYYNMQGTVRSLLELNPRLDRALANHFDTCTQDDKFLLMGMQRIHDGASDPDTPPEDFRAKLLACVERKKYVWGLSHYGWDNIREKEPCLEAVAIYEEVLNEQP